MTSKVLSSHERKILKCEKWRQRYLEETRAWCRIYDQWIEKFKHD